MAYINGHYHPGGYHVQDNIHYYCPKAILESPLDNNAYSIVEVYNNKLEVKGFGIVENCSLLWSQ